MDAGLNPDRVLVMGVPLPPAKYDTADKRNRFFLELMARWEADVGAEAKERHLPTRSCRALTGSR